MVLLSQRVAQPLENNFASGEAELQLGLLLTPSS